MADGALYAPAEMRRQRRTADLAPWEAEAAPGSRVIARRNGPALVIADAMVMPTTYCSGTGFAWVLFVAAHARIGGLGRVGNTGATFARISCRKRLAVS